MEQSFGVVCLEDVPATTLRDRLALGGDANSLAAGAAVGTVCHNALVAVDLGKQATTLSVFVCLCWET